MKRTILNAILLRLLCCSVLLILISCSSEKPTGGTDESKGGISAESSSAAKEGESAASREQQPASVSHKNALPVVTSAQFAYVPSGSGSVMSLEAAGKDDDGDEVTFVYEWTKNGEAAGNTKRLESPLKRGDKISVKVTPFDGKEYGRSIILNREIQNMSPVITEQKEIFFDQKVLKYQVKAFDPDGDTLQYSLKSGPPGMTIDPATGLIQWNVPSDFKGDAAVTITVNDGHGGEAIGDINFQIGK